MCAYASNATVSFCAISHVGRSIIFPDGMLVFAPRRRFSCTRKLACCTQKLVKRFSHSTTATSTTVDAEELEHFKHLSVEKSSNWQDEAGPFKALHSLNRIRIPWIVSNLVGRRHDPSGKGPLDGLRIVDIGAGGGLLSAALCRLGANVVALDASESAIRAAKDGTSRILSNELINRLDFKAQTVESFAEENTEAFDAVVASEVVEHVVNVETFISSCVKLAKRDSKARLFFTTINKTACSRVLAVWMAENVLSIVPKGIHDWEKFVEPERLRVILNDAGCKAGPPSGLLYNPLSNRWSWSQITAVNYALMAIKP